MELRQLVMFLVLILKSISFVEAHAVTSEPEDCSPGLSFTDISWNDTTISWNRTCFNNDVSYNISIDRNFGGRCVDTSYNCSESSCQISMSDFCHPISDSCTDVKFTVNGTTSNVTNSLSTTVAPRFIGDWKLDKSDRYGSTLNAKWGPPDNHDPDAVACATKALVDATCKGHDISKEAELPDPGQGTVHLNISGCIEEDVILIITYMAGDYLTETKGNITLPYDGETTTTPETTTDTTTTPDTTSDTYTSPKVTSDKTTTPDTTSDKTTTPDTTSDTNTTPEVTSDKTATPASTSDTSSVTQHSSTSTPDTSVKTTQTQPPVDSVEITGIVIGILVGLVIIVILIYCFIKKKLCFRVRKLDQRRPSMISAVSLRSILRNYEEEGNIGAHNKAVSWNENIPMEPMAGGTEKKKVVIFNYEKFLEPLKKRDGATKDSKNLSKKFKEMGYDVSSHQNLTKEQTKEVLDKIQNDKSMAMLILIILSHGLDRKSFYTVEGSTMDLDHIRYRFTDSQCPQLKGNPKIILSNFCRGHDIESQTVAQAFKRLSHDTAHQTDASCYREVPHHMITIHATVENIKALRDPEQGTIFVTSLCKILKKDQELNDMYNQLYEEMQIEKGTTPMMESFAPLPIFSF